MKYEYKGKVYIFIREGKMQIGQTWVPCAVYTNYRGTEYFVRELVDFKEKFKYIVK